MDHSRPLGLGSDSGLQDRTGNSPSATVITPSCKTFFNTGSSVRAGSKQIVSKASNSPYSSFKPGGGIYQFYVCGAQKDGGSRPVVNLKPFDQYLAYEHFKMEGIHMLRDLLKKGDFLVKIDLKDAYLKVPIWKNHQKYLRFLWKGSMQEFGCLPFGLATAPRVFTKLMKPVVGALRQRGIRLIIYLDDLLIMAESHDQALHHAASKLNLLEGLGFIVNYQKSQLLPSQKIEFLIDSNTMTLQHPGEKLRKIRKKCQELLAQTTVSVRELSKFLGLLTSSIQAIFPAPLHYRHLQRLKNTTLASQKIYNAMVALDQAAHEEILWWRDHLHTWNGRALFQDPVDLVIETDASRKGWGAYCQGVRTGGPWSFEEKRLHINCLELLAGSLAVKTFTKSKVCAHVELLMDSTSAVAYVNKMGGTHSKSLANLPIDLWEWCFQNHLIVSAQHLSGRLNERADRESRVLEESSDWKLSPNIFQTLQNKWGPFEVDLFASRLTKQLPKFASWKPDPMAAYTDALSLDWGQILGLCFSPIRFNRPLCTTVEVSESRSVSSGSTSVADSTLVPLTTANVCRTSTTVPNVSTTSNEGQSIASTRQHPVSWVEAVGQHYKTTDLSAETRNVLLAAWRQNTSSAYASAWSKWVCWCGQRKIDPLSAPIEVVRFSYRTV